VWKTAPVTFGKKIYISNWGFLWACNMAAENFGQDAYILWQIIWAERLPQGFLRLFMAVDASSYRNLLEFSRQYHTGF
jgi:hypothetical protein